jgi:hypothetical protein
MVVFNQSVLAPSLLKLTTRDSLFDIVSDEKMDCLLCICLALCQVHVSHIQRVIEILPFALHTKSWVSTGFAKQIMPSLRILRYNGSLITWMVVSLSTAKFKPLIFSVYGFALFCTAVMCVLMILYDFSLLPAQFCYIIIYIGKVESCVQIANWCAPWKIFSGAENLVLQVLQF